MQKEEKLEEITKRINECKACDLYRFCNNKVPGSGPANAKMFLIGEAPGRKEDETGLPFVGAAGKLLDELLERAGLRREKVFIGNIVKCRPPKNRDPTEEEINACSHFLDEQLEVIQPRIIITLGRYSMEHILNKFKIPERYSLKNNEIKISKLHGKEFSVDTLNGKVKIIVMYHPAAGIYHGEVKRKMFEDWEKLTF